MQPLSLQKTLVLKHISAAAQGPNFPRAWGRSRPAMNAFVSVGAVSAKSTSAVAPVARSAGAAASGARLTQRGGRSAPALSAMAMGAGLVALRRLGGRARVRGIGQLRPLGRPLQRRAAAVMAPPEEILGIKPDGKYNVPAGVREKLGKNLLLNSKHPLGILWKTVQEQGVGR